MIKSSPPLLNYVSQWSGIVCTLSLYSFIAIPHPINYHMVFSRLYYVTGTELAQCRLAVWVYFYLFFSGLSLTCASHFETTILLSACWTASVMHTRSFLSCLLPISFPSSRVQLLGDCNKAMWAKRDDSIWGTSDATQCRDWLATGHCSSKHFQSGSDMETWTCQMTDIRNQFWWTIYS